MNIRKNKNDNDQEEEIKQNDGENEDNNDIINLDLQGVKKFPNNFLQKSLMENLQK